MNALLLWVPCRSYMPVPVPLLRRLLADGAGEIESGIPGLETKSRLIQKIENADLIFADQSFFNALHGVKPDDGWQPEQEPPQPEVAELWEAVRRAQAVKVLGLTHNDLHWLNVPGNPSYCAADLAGFAREFHALVWCYEQWGDCANGLLPVLREPWMDVSGDPTANWKALAGGIRCRFDYPFALNPQEIRHPGRRAIWDVSVIGAHYGTRAAALRSAQEQGLSIAPFRRAASLTARVVRLRQRLLRKSHELDLLMRRRTMDYTASHSAVNFVCGGGVRYLVRKYFEFAAIGACMATWPAAGLRHCGFRHGEHLVFCDDPSDFGITARWLRPRSALRESMGRAAQEMVHVKHTVAVRASQMLAWLRELARGRDVRGVWHEGEFQLAAA